MNLELSEIRKLIDLDISLGSKRPLELQEARYFFINFDECLPLMPPGLTQLTLIFVFLRYFAKYLVMEIIPALIAEYSIGLTILVLL